MRKAFVAAVVLLTLTAAFTGIGLGSQEAQQAQMTPEQFFDLLRQDIEKDRIALVGAAMGFTAEQASAFWPIYEEYTAELNQLGDREVEIILDYSRSYQTMTDDKARELAKGVLAVDGERIALLGRYFDRIDEALGAIIAARFIQVENQLNNLIDVQVASEIPLIGG